MRKKLWKLYNFAEFPQLLSYMKGLVLYDIARDLFIKFGIKSVSMDDISREAGMSKKTVYSLIPDKASLINTVIKRFTKKEEDEINAIVETATDALDEMVKITEHVLDFFRRFNPRLTYDLKKYYKSSWTMIENTHFQFIRNCIQKNIERGKKEGIYRKEVNEKIISRLYVQSSRVIVNEDVFPMQEFPKVVLFEKFIEYHIYGILNDKGLKKYKKYKK